MNITKLTLTGPDFNQTADVPKYDPEWLYDALIPAIKKLIAAAKKKTALKKLADGCEICSDYAVALQRGETVDPFEDSEIEGQWQLVPSFK